jgi:hypothetical protein
MGAVKCPKGPHDCQAVWECHHGRPCPRHKPDGSFCYTSDAGKCPECRTECAAATEKVEVVDGGLYRALHQ